MAVSRTRFIKAIAALTLMGSGAMIGSAAAEQAAQSKADWAKTVRMSPMGGHILGNPLARNRIVEFVSYTCPHCAEYAEASAVAMKTRYIPSGKTSVEVRNFVRDPFDLTAALLARCGSKDRFFGNHEAILGAQKDWVGKASSATEAQRNRWANTAMPQRLSLIAKDIGLAALMKERGYSDAEIASCASDQDEMNLLIKMTQNAANDVKIKGTPSFTINGKLVDKAYSWEALRPKLDAL